MISLWLTALLCLASIHKPARCVLIAAIMLVQWLHFQWFDATPSALTYYGTAALADALIVGMLSRCRGALAADLTLINATAVCVHATGWLAYEAYLPPTAYNAAIQVLYCAQIARMLWQGGEDDNGRLAAHSDWHLPIRIIDPLRAWTRMGKTE